MATYTLSIKAYGDRGVMWCIEAPDGKMVGSWRTARNGSGVWLEGADGLFHQTQGADSFTVYGASNAKQKLRRFAVEQAKSDVRFLIAGRGNHAAASDEVMYGDHAVTIQVRESAI
jgi:hypothetical protein